MKNLITLLIIALFILPVSAQDILTPRTDLLELRVKLSDADKSALGKWSLREFRLRQASKPRSFDAYRAFALLRISDDDFFAEIYIQMIAGLNIDNRTGSDDKATYKIINRLASSKNPDEKRLAWYFCDYIADCLPQQKEMAALRDKLPKGNWTHMLPKRFLTG